MTKKEITIDESKKIQLEMLHEIHNFCEKNCIKYFLAFGTMLGAIRHNGFIPWDDDVDIYMPYEDFHKFQLTFNTDKYTISTCQNDKELGFDFGRIYDNRTYGLYGKKRIKGVCIDIYFLFGAPQNQDINKLNKFLNNYRETRRKITRVRNLLNKLNLLWGSSSFWPLNYYCNRYLNKVSKYTDKSHYCICGGERFAFESKWFEDRILHKFEDGLFYIPKGYDELLTKFYGDYMTPPPEDKRHPWYG